MVSVEQEITTGAENIVWNLSGLYAGLDDPQIDADMAKLDQMATDFMTEYQGKVANLDGEEMRTAMESIIKIFDLQSRLYYFGYLNNTTDTADPKIGALLQKVTEFVAKINQKLVFFELEWNKVDQQKVDQLLNDPVLADYRHHLEAERRYQPYQLSEAEEKVLLRKDVTGRAAWVRYYTQIVSTLRCDLDGEELTFTKALNKLLDPDRSIREKAAASITVALQARSLDLTYIFNVLTADKYTDDELRGYPTWIKSRNLSNKAPDAVVEALIEAVTSRYDIVSRHYEFKRKLMGLDELIDYDRFAPLPVEGSDKVFQWDEAREIVLNAFKAFHPRIAETAGLFFENKWIHAKLMPNKRGGAYAAPVTDTVNPFVFLNYDGKDRDVAALAHELGHGIHMYLSGRANGYLALNHPLTIAEMASVFGEMLVFSDLLSREENEESRLAMLVAKVEDSFGTVFRQIAFNRFEDQLHEKRRSEGELSTEQLNEIWLQISKDLYGDSIKLREDFGIWWGYIRHFLATPGYVYAYSFGELLVLALYDLYLEQGESFAPKYIEVLEAGDTEYPDKLLAKLDVDLNDPQFWHRGLNALEAMVEQEETLARQLYPEKFA